MKRASKLLAAFLMVLAAGFVAVRLGGSHIAPPTSAEMSGHKPGIPGSARTSIKHGGTDVTADSASQVLKHVEAVGASQALRDYFEGPYWESILEQIASGDEQWLRVRANFRGVSDAHASEDLDGALFDALPVRPFRVLALMKEEHRLSEEQLCIFTFEAECPAAGIEAFLTALERSLNQAHTPEEKEARRSCMKGIAATRDMFRNNPNYCSGAGA